MYRRILIFLLLITFSVGSAELYAQKYALKPQKVVKPVSVIGAESISTQLTVYNESDVDATDFEYVTTLGGQSSEPKKVTLPGLSRGYSCSTTIVLPVGKAVGQEELTIEITKVNGQDNTSSAKSIKTPLITVARKVEHKALVEEYTATWCQWCPRGIVAMDMLAEEKANNAVTIAAHYSDVMSTYAYSTLTSRCPGYPKAQVNRVEYIDPYYGSTDMANVKPIGIFGDVDKDMQRVAEADVQVSAVWNADHSQITVSSATTFLYSHSTSNYALAYVLVADSLYNSGWTQSNKYSGYNYMLTDAPKMEVFVEGGSYVRGLYFNHVAIDGKEVVNGINGSIVAPIVQDEVQKHTVTFDNIKGNNLVQNIKNLSVCALLIDRQTGMVVNCNRCDIGESATTSICEKPMASDKKEVSRYNMQGQRINAPTKGINVIVYDNGSTEKVLVP